MTVRINKTTGPPTTQFVLHADRVGQSKVGNYTIVRLIVEAISQGSSGGSSSYALTHRGGIDGVGYGQHSVSSLPSGYGPGAKRWTANLGNFNVPHNANGSRGAVVLRMSVITSDSDLAGVWTVSFSDFPTIVNVPDAPSDVAASRVSDSQGSVTWTRNSTGNKLWTGVYIERWAASTNTWTQVANVTGNVTSWTDTGLSVNDRYKYRVQAYNSAGSSAFAESGFFPTTPAAASGVSAARDDMDIIVTWQNNARYETGSDIYDNDVLVGSVGAGVYSFLHEDSNPSVVHTYKIKTKADSLESAFSTPSNSVQLQAPPLKPLDVGVRGQAFALESETDPVVAFWKHNPVDSSAQRKFDLQIKVSGVWQDLKTNQTSSVQESNIRPDMGANWTLGLKEIRVRTWGAHADPSPYSDAAAFSIENRPVISIISPSEPTFDLSQMTVEWSYNQAQGRAQTSAKIEVFKDDVLVHSVTHNGAGTSRTLAYTFLDDSTYQIAVEVTSSSGLKSGKRYSPVFYVDYLEPSAPIVLVEFSTDSGSHQISISNESEPIDAEFNRVYRNISEDSEWMQIEPGDPTPEFISEEWELVGEYPANSTISDFRGRTMGKTVYLVEAVSSIPSVSRGWSFAIVNSKRIWIGAGAEYGSVVSIPYDVKISSKTGISDQQEYEFEGRSKPVLVSGDMGFVDISASGSLDPLGIEGSTREQIESLSLIPGPKMYRDLEGRRVALSIKSFDFDRDSRVSKSVKFSGTQVES